jgi:hypothetical protein
MWWGTNLGNTRDKLVGGEGKKTRRRKKGKSCKSKKREEK